jgi:hypothetical protein
MNSAEAAARGRLGASVRNAKYGQAERAAFTAPARAARRTKLEQSVIETYQLDPEAADFAYRLQQGISAHYRSIRLMAGKRSSK